MADYRGVNYLRRRLQIKSERVKMRYKYYEMKNRVKDFQISTPPELRNVQSVLGWCGKAVDNLADRIVFREFTNDNFDIGEIFLMNNPDTFFDSAVLSALISSCCFVYISVDKTGFPKLQVIDGAKVTPYSNEIKTKTRKQKHILQKATHGYTEKETRRRRELKTTYHTRFLSRSYSGRMR